TEIVELPINQGGKVVRMEIAAVELEVLIPFLKGIVPAGRDVDAAAADSPMAGLDAVLHTTASLEEQARGFASMGAFVSPQLAFDGPEPGKLEWRRLHLGNRVHLINAVSTLAGQGPGRADALGTFSDERGSRRRDGDAVGASRAAGGTAQ